MTLQTVDEIYQDLPLVHWAGTHTFHIPKQMAEFISRTVEPGMVTLETGCGVSTVVFALRGCRHTVITPRAAEIERVYDYLRRHGIDTGDLTALIGSSQDLLPGLSTAPLDFVLIDGQHAFPVPFIDWYYSARSMRVGGTVVIDDTQIWTGRSLRNFLAAEDGWEQTNDFFGRAASFRKITEEVDAAWWGRQPFVLAHTRRGRLAEAVRRRVAVATRRMENRHNAKAPMSPAARAVISDDDPAQVSE